MPHRAPTPPAGGDDSRAARGREDDGRQGARPRARRKGWARAHLRQEPTGCATAPRFNDEWKCLGMSETVRGCPGDKSGSVSAQRGATSPPRTANGLGRNPPSPLRCVARTPLLTRSLSSALIGSPLLSLDKLEAPPVNGWSGCRCGWSQSDRGEGRGGRARARVSRERGHGGGGSSSKTVSTRAGRPWLGPRGSAGQR